MGFCGCSLKASTNLAGLLAILNFFFFVPIDVGLIISIHSSKHLETENSPGWNHFVKGFSALHKTNVFIILLFVRLSLHIVWLITVPLIFIGNVTNRRNYLYPWESVAIVKILYMLGGTTYFLVGNNQCGFLERLPIWITEYIEKPSEASGEQAARLVTLLDLGDGGPILWVLTILLIACVHMRGLQIKYTKKENSLTSTSTPVQLMPYQSAIRIPRARISESTEDLILRPSNRISTISSPEYYG